MNNLRMNVVLGNEDDRIMQYISTIERAMNTGVTDRDAEALEILAVSLERLDILTTPGICRCPICEKPHTLLNEEGEVEATTGICAWCWLKGDGESVDIVLSAGMDHNVIRDMIWIYSGRVVPQMWGRNR